MGIFKSLLYGASSEPLEQNFGEYTETFGKKPALINCDLNFIKTLPNNAYDCCVKLQMDVFLREDSPSLISESEAAHIANVRSILSEHIDGIFVGQGIIGATSSTFLMFYISSRQASSCRQMLNETFLGSFRHVEISMVLDPDGLQYKKYLYPNTLQMKKIENLKVLKSLKGYGDDGGTPRPVKFVFVFSNKKAALDFYSATTEKGFIYKDMISEPAPEGMVLPRYKLILEKTIPFNVDLLMLIDDYLLKLVAQYSGEYKSLETEIVEIK